MTVSISGKVLKNIGKGIGKFAVVAAASFIGTSLALFVILSLFYGV